MMKSVGWMTPVLVVLIGVLLGTYSAQNSRYRMLIGMFPFFSSDETNWGFRFEQLYHEKTANNLKGQTALVTGANSGIGYEVSLALARNGVFVTMACRNETKCNNAATRIKTDPQVIRRFEKNENMNHMLVETLIMDTSSLASVKEAAETYKEQMTQSSSNHEPKALDMLFLNAGIGFVPGKSILDRSVTLTKDGIELLFATNVLGHHLLYKILEPLLLRSKMARVVLTSSAGSFNTFNFKVATSLEMLNNQTNPISLKNYGHTKLAQIVWAKAITHQLSMSHPTNNVYVNAGHPGAVDTNIWFTQPIPILHIDSFRSKFMWTSAEGALTMLYLAVGTDDLVKQNIRGKYFHPQSQEVVNPLALNETLQRNFLDFCNELVRDFL